MPAGLIAALPAIATAGGSIGAAAIGARSAGQAAKRAERTSAAANQQAYDLEERRLQFEREESDRQRKEEQARWEAEQEWGRKMWEAQEEERLYRRQKEEEKYAREIAEDEARAAARAAYVEPEYGPAPPEDPRIAQRRALQQNALAMLPGLLNTQSPYRPATAPIVPQGVRR